MCLAKKCILLPFLLFLLASKYTFAQEKIPHISGKVIIKMQDGLINADLKLSNLPSLDTAFRILLNRGMNMKLIRDSSGVVKYNDTPGDDCFKYRPHDGKKYISSPKALRLSYTGAFPVYTDTLNFYDYKGVIALNGKTLRASEQSKWYPVLYDTKNDREYTAVTYNITVECADCKMIYINGSSPQKGPVATFRSDKPYELLLFTGDYEQQVFSGSDFLNAGMPDDAAAAFNDQIVAIKGFYQKKLKVPYQQKITFVQHQPIELYGPNRSWGFVTFPSIAVAGGQFNNQIDMKTKKFNHMVKYSFYSHELAHYYFGNLLSPNSTLRFFFLESTAEYLSVKSAASAYGSDSTRSYIKYAKKLLAAKKIVPLSQISSAEQIDDVYRYNYGPMVFLALEKRVGEDKVYKLLQNALKHKGEKTDYTFFKTIAAESGISTQEWKDFESQVISLTDASLIFQYL